MAVKNVLPSSGMPVVLQHPDAMEVSAGLAAEVANIAGKSGVFPGFAGGAKRNSSCLEEDIEGPSAKAVRIESKPVNHLPEILKPSFISKCRKAFADFDWTIRGSLY